MNDRLRSELSYCVPLGIPHSRFLSWDQDDQDKALAYVAEIATVCSGCGTREAEWEADKDAYIGDLIKCPGCERLAQEENNVPDEEKNKGWRIRLLPKLVARALMADRAEDGGKRKR